MIWENIKLALGGLRSNKMRALLTMLGIIIGIGSVIAIVTVGNSLTSSVSESLVAMGGNNLQLSVDPRPDENGDYPSSYGYMESDLLSDEMLQAYQERFARQIKAVVLTESGGAGRIQQGANTAKVNITGVNQGYFDAGKCELAAGRALNETDQEGARQVALVSDLLVENLFGGDAQAALGQTIEVTGPDGGVNEFSIVGVYVYQTMGPLLGGGTVNKNTTTDLYLPLAMVHEMEGIASGSYFWCEVVPAAGVDADAFQTRSEQFFEERFYKNNEQFRVTVYNLQNEMSSITSVLGTISLAIGVIAGISLLVGGIGVMNIMLVSITERTREIGIRKALGASNGAIRTQFIVESVVICLVGGALGILVGFGLGSLGASLIGAPARADLGTVLVAVGFSMGIGVFFGYYPANKAAKLDPIEALRYE
ncbi:ABC transporter permease [Candidatus Allofournierella excrementavium]|uniref:ABC transporter permease n=1 Tax=Candidatus Allofournierella excrementavium TaxID=2838591 RepID=UPI003A88ABA6